MFSLCIKKNQITLNSKAQWIHTPTQTFLHPDISECLCMQNTAVIRIKYVSKVFALLNYYPVSQLSYLFYSDINKCLSTPCLNGGVCEDLVKNYTCTCTANFTGSHCETGASLFQTLKSRSKAF